MKQYTDLLANILENGDLINTERTGVGTIAIFGETLKFNLQDGFPAVTTKKLAWKAVVSELIWFLRGSTNVNELREILHGSENKFNDKKFTIWDANYQKQGIDLGYENGELGMIYGSQWRNFGSGRINGITIKGIDQVKEIINEASTNPSSRRLVVSAWNPKVIWDSDEHVFKVDKAALPPCHMLFQINIVGDFIDLQWTQRSCDVFLGGSFNCASYGLLCHIFGRILNKKPRYLVAFIGNAHIYMNHIDQCKEQLTREHYDLPELWINPDLKTLEDFENSSIDDYKLINYKHHPTIKADMAV